MDKDLGKLVIEISAKLDKLQGQLGEAEKRTKDAGSRMEGAFKNVAGAVGIAFGTGQIIEFGKEAVMLAGKLEGVKKAFDRIGDPNLLAGLRAATRGTVTDLNLMVAAVKANNFQIPIKEMGTLLEFASRRAQETGENVDYLVESIVTGISRKSIMILDNLGISATRLKEAMGGASLESKSVGEVTAAVAGIARQELNKMGDSVMTTADKIEQLKVRWENFLTGVGTRINTLITLAGKFVDTMDKVSGNTDWTYFLMGGGRFGAPYTIPDQDLPDGFKTWREKEKKRLAEINSPKQKTSPQTVVQENKAIANSYGDIKKKIEDLQAAQAALVYGSKEWKASEEQIARMMKSIGMDTGKARKAPSEIREQYYNDMEFKAAGYFEFELKQIAKEEAELRRAAIAETEIAEWKYGKMKALSDKFFATDPLQRVRPERTAAELAADQRAYDAQVMAEFNQGYGRETVDPVDQFLSNFENAPKNSAPVYDEFWDKQMSAVSDFAGAMSNAFQRSGDDGSRAFMSVLQIGLQIASVISRMDAGKITGGEAGFGIVTSLLGLIGLHGGGTVSNTGGRVMLGKGYAGGTDFIVPNGFPNDSYPIRVESGERVTVTPASGVSAQEIALNGVMRQLQVMNYNIATGGNGGGKQELALSLTGRIDGTDINLANTRAQRLRGRYE